MTTLTEFISTIKSWTNVESHSDALITSWVRMAEERLNHELRHRDQITRSTATLNDDTTDLPVDWLELVYVRYPGGAPLEYVTNDEMWQRKQDYHPRGTTDCYTIIGNTLVVNPTPEEATEVEISYYAELVPIDDEGDNAFLTKHPRIMTFATLALSAPYMVEDERIMVWETEATRLIQMMNESSRRSQQSGSPLKARMKSFG